jgi:hypothetical protein
VGFIQQEVRDLHLALYPLEERLLLPFLHHFSVTWARRRKAHNAEVSAYFLKPDGRTREAFGLQHEVVLVYSSRPEMEARTLQAAESFLFDVPGAGRVDQLVYFIISDAPDARDWIADYQHNHRESRMVVVFSPVDLREAADDKWIIWNTLEQQLFSRDLFDNRLPLEHDTYFFGRDEIVRSYRDSIRMSENRGIFGLRKTGKTSVLFKLERLVNSDPKSLLLYYDGKNPAVRQLRWHEFLGRICRDIAEHSNARIDGAFSERVVSETFIGVVRQAAKSKRVILVFDEIEYISPVAIADVHWHLDFVPFWQTFWTCQSRCRQLSTIIAGVNPTVVELATIGGIQNPLFGIVSYQYLKGFSRDELTFMLKSLGSRMGLRFERSAVAYLHERYGGHPLLTRMACSTLNAQLRTSGISRPVDVSREILEQTQAERDMELMFYCRHVISELEQFYPDEYRMLEWLASGELDTFIQFAPFQEFTKHLRDYGLLTQPAGELPRISIPVIERYIGLELARREGRRTILRVVSPVDRAAWVRRRVDALLSDLHTLERHIRTAGTATIYGPNSIPDAQRLAATKPCCTEDDFVQFVNTWFRCFVESIEVYGKSVGVADHYRSVIQRTYPQLWHALQRIRVYRHAEMHLMLRDAVDAEQLEYLARDLEGRSPSQVEDVWFVLQQAIMDGLFTGMQAELARLS